VSEAVLIEAPGMNDVIEAIVTTTGCDERLIRVRGEERRFELARSALAWTASGTATLECALLDVPMVVGYKLRPLTYAVARLLVNVPDVALVNLIAGRTAVPELLQKEWRPDRLAEVASDLLKSGGLRQRDELAVVRRRLGGQGASRKAAEAILEKLDASGIG
jgi:lipid-A-disaccharide synthase